MGLPKSAVHLLLHTAAQHAFSGAIATLGRQHVYLTAAELVEQARHRGVALKETVPTLHRAPALRRLGYLSDDSLYEMLGFERSLRIDHSDYESSEETLDLNARETPWHLVNAFDLVLDSGTIEHVFDLAQAITHCLNMTRIGGRVIHLTPTSNCVNHGFYSVSPTFFSDFYTASRCSVEALYLCRLPKKNFERHSWSVYDCQASDRNWLPLGRLDGSIWLTFCVARKHPESVPTVAQQSMYETTWAVAQADKAPNSSEENSKAARMLRLTKRYPFVHRLAQGVIDEWRKKINARKEYRRGRVPYPFLGRF